MIKYMDFIVGITFKNGYEVFIRPYDTELNRTFIEKSNFKKLDKPLYYQLDTTYVGFSDRQISLIENKEEIKKESIERIIKSFNDLNMELHPALVRGELTLKDCNEIHRIFTTNFLELRHNRPPSEITVLNETLQGINHGVHDYESVLHSENYMECDELPRTILVGYEIWDQMGEFAYNVPNTYDRTELADLYDHADVFYWDDCRLGRNFATAWYMGDDPMAWDVADIDAIVPIFKLGNNKIKRLYSDTKFLDWLAKGNYDFTVPFKDVPFGKIINPIEFTNETVTNMYRPKEIKIYESI